jgi:hypothetical protein
MVSSLNLAYIHLRLDEIFAKEEWFGGVNVLFVGDILQLPPVNGAAVFEKVNNRSVTTKLGCMTSVNIWQENVVYDELTINERQKKDQVFSSMLDEVRQGCPSQQTVQALNERVLTTPTIDKFEELLSENRSPLCLFPTREVCLKFNSEMLSRLVSETKEIPCIDEVETQGTFKWSEKATEALKKLNSDCNMTAGLEAVLQVAVGARVMLCRNIDTSSRLVNGAVGTVISIKAHHITVQFDSRQEPHHVESQEQVHAAEEGVRTSQAVPTDPGICRHRAQVPRSVVGLCHHGPLGPGVLCRYGICGTVTCETAREPALDFIPAGIDQSKQ